jgi:hypothetical protein
MAGLNYSLLFDRSLLDIPSMDTLSMTSDEYVSSVSVSWIRRTDLCALRTSEFGTIIYRLDSSFQRSDS